GDLMGTQLVSANFAAGPAPAAYPSSQSLASGAGLEGRLGEAPTPPGVSPPRPAPVGIFPRKPPGWPLPPQPERSGGSASPEVADHQCIDAVFTSLAREEPPVPLASAAGDASPAIPDSLWAELGDEVVTQGTRLLKDGLAARRLPG